MRSLRRLGAPAVLVDNGETWTAAFLDKRATNAKARPSRSQYAHREITDALAAMSFHKCFYCEQLVRDRHEVDHYIEVAEAPERAFDWSNLYLACFECNRKKATNRQHSAAECVDPCDPATDPAAHLTFTDEIVRALGASPRGLATIQKYRLGRADLDSVRKTYLLHFERALNQIKDAQIRDKREQPTAAELELLRSFAAPDRPFSRMFSARLQAAGLLEEATPAAQ